MRLHVAYSPHHDSWCYCPTNCFDVWMALGPVQRGNGLSIFFDAHGRRLPCDEKGVVRRDRRFDRPVNFDIGPGDILVFAGEHLHSLSSRRSSATRPTGTGTVRAGAPPG